MKSSDVRIRLAQVSDAERMIHVHFNAVHAIPEGHYSEAVFQAWSPKPTSSRYEWMRDRICSSSHVALVAELHDAVCGFAICSLPDGFIQAIYVDPKSSGRGMGRELLEAVERHLFQAGASLFKLNSSTNSVDFYRAMGYRVNAQATQSLADGSEMSCYEMHKAVETAA